MYICCYTSLGYPTILQDSEWSQFCPISGSATDYNVLYELGLQEIGGTEPKFSLRTFLGTNWIGNKQGLGQLSLNSIITKRKKGIHEIKLLRSLLWRDQHFPVLHSSSFKHFRRHCQKHLEQRLSLNWLLLSKMEPSTSGTTLFYEGSNFFRQRLIISTLCNRPVKIKNIRHKDEDPGIRDFESNFLKLLGLVSNGCRIDVDETGTTVYYQPGLLYGGKLDHDCGNQRSVSYSLEALICFAPFCKKPMDITLRGITNDKQDPSVDAVKSSVIPVLKRFLGTDEGLELKITSRGVPPEGGGEVTFCCPIRRQLRPIQFLNPGKIKRVRGVAFAVRVSPAMANRMVETAKGILLQFLPDVYIYTDLHKGRHSGKSPGFGISLVAETTDGAFMSAEEISNPSGSDKGPSVPEDIAEEAAHSLLQEVYRGGCVDSISQSVACLFMALGPPDVSKLKTGQLTLYTMQFLRHLRDFTNIMFKLDMEIKDEDDNQRTGSDKIILTCLGNGYTNLGKTLR